MTVTAFLIKSLEALASRAQAYVQRFCRYMPDLPVKGRLGLKSAAFRLDVISYLAQYVYSLSLRATL